MSRKPILLLFVAVACAACGSTQSAAPSRPASSSVAVASSSPRGSSVAGGPEAPAATQKATRSPKSTPTATPDPTPTPSPSPSPTSTVAPSPKPTPAPWKSFASKRYRYSIKYPPTWVATPGTAKLSDQFDSFGYPYVYISRDTVNGSVSVNLTVNHDIAYIKSHYHGKLVSNKSIRLAGGYRGRVLTYTARDNGLKVTLQNIIVAKGRSGYFIDLIADYSTRVADMKLFRRIYLSWRPK